MKINSLAFRLFVTAAGWASIVLPIAGFLIFQLYRQEVENSFDRRIGVLLTVVLSDSIDQGGGEPGAPKEVGEPLFEITHSGWYWQIKPLDGKGGRRLVSTSLASEDFKLPSDANVPPDDKEVRWANLEGPLGQTLRVAETVHIFGEGKQGTRYSIAVAGTLAEIQNNIDAFRTRLVTSLALAGIGLLAVTLFQVRFGLYPLRRIEKGLADIRSGTTTRLEGDLPDEIISLQNELNLLLKANQDTVDRARTQVGNLAHALKTPLAVIINEARDDNGTLARKVIEQADVMRTQVNHYLDRARIAAQAGVIGRITEVKPVSESITRALDRIYRDKSLTFAVACPDEARFLGEKQDLEEMLGNLLDNAAKWASSKVELSAILHAPRDKTGTRAIEIRVDDDGPGLSAEQLAQPIQRGRRLDETKPGSGLGHSIVADLAHSYRGSFSLDKSPLGGLSARLTLPAA
jgi:signal transduction histidine kinase